jgi:hypothetical protein
MMLHADLALARLAHVHIDPLHDFRAACLVESDCLGHRSIVS